MRWRRNRALGVVTDETPARDDWLVKGSEVVHTTFGTGTIAHVGDYKTVPAVWIDFDAGVRRTLEIQYALPHLRPRRPQDAATPADPKERCDYCGGRPVVVSVTGPGGTRRCCDTHRADLAGDLRR